MGQQCIGAEDPEAEEIINALKYKFPYRQHDLERILPQLFLHNKLRAKHGSAPLKLSYQLCEKAMMYSAKLKSIGKLAHSGDSFNGEDMGQNLAFNSTPSIKMTQIWYSQKSKYNFAKGQAGEAGHFCQVVWRDSKLLGLGFCQGYCVANYFPAGNYEQYFKENVFQGKD